MLGELFKVNFLKNGSITNAGLQLNGELLSPSSCKFIRFSTRTNIATAFEVQVYDLNTVYVDPN